MGSEVISNGSDFILCIPTYKRSDAIAGKTLRVLKEQGIPASIIHLYVANADEQALYESSVSRDLYGHIHIGCPGLAAVRNFIMDAWPTGARIVMMDDDVTDVMTIDESARLVRADLKRVIAHGFELAAARKLSLWGVYPVCNGFFMKNNVTFDLRFCVGPLFGIFNNEIRLPLGVDSKEDYVRTLLAFDRDKGIVRMNNVAIKTRIYMNSGGLCGPDRVRQSQYAADYICTRWPVAVKKKTKSKFAEIRLKIEKGRHESVEAPSFCIGPVGGAGDA